jgi:hypothetical protein
MITYGRSASVVDSCCAPSLSTEFSHAAESTTILLASTQNATPFSRYSRPCRSTTRAFRRSGSPPPRGGCPLERLHYFDRNHSPPAKDLVAPLSYRVIPIGTRSPPFRPPSIEANSRKLLEALAPRAGFEPATLRLTAGCSAVELPRNAGERADGVAAASLDNFRILADPPSYLGASRLIDFKASALSAMSAEPAGYLLWLSM